jgi:hypothetical protein
MIYPVYDKSGDGDAYQQIRGSRKEIRADTNAIDYKPDNRDKNSEKECYYTCYQHYAS